MKNNLKNIREKRGITQIQVAQKVQITERGYQYIEAGKRIPNVYLAIKIAKVLNSTVEELFPLSAAEVQFDRTTEQEK